MHIYKEIIKKEIDTMLAVGIIYPIDQSEWTSPMVVQPKKHDPTKIKDGELGKLLETLAMEAKTRSQNRHRELDDNEKEQVKFLKKCRNLV